MKWINEQEAAEILGFKNTVWFRQLVKQGKIPVKIRSTNGRKYQYEENSIKKFQNQTTV